MVPRASDSRKYPYSYIKGTLRIGLNLGNIKITATGAAPILSDTGGKNGACILAAERIEMAGGGIAAAANRLDQAACLCPP